MSDEAEFAKELTLGKCRSHNIAQSVHLRHRLRKIYTFFVYGPLLFYFLECSTMKKINIIRKLTLDLTPFLRTEEK